MLSLYPHQSYSKWLERQIQEAVSKVHDSVNVESVTLSEENCSQEINDQSFTHRFLVTIVEPFCCDAPSPFCSSAQSTPEDSDRFDVINACQLQRLEPSVIAIANSADESAMNEQRAFNDVQNMADATVAEMPMANNDMDFSLVETLEQTETLAVSSDISEGDSDNEVFYPLTENILHEAINEQLNKSTSSNFEGWSSSLFKDVATADPGGGGEGAGDQNQTTSSTVQLIEQVPFQSQQHPQSNEISSSTWDTVAVSSTHHQSTISLPPMTHQRYFLNDDTSVAFSTDQINLSISSSPQDYLPPANLPAVSALITGGIKIGSLNWTLSRASTAVLNASTIVELADPGEHVEMEPSHSGFLMAKYVHPAVRSQKTSLASSNLSPRKIRSRKTSPSLQLPLKSNSLTAGTTSHNPDSSPSSMAPEGHTYESWIIQEGLTKVRQQIKHEKKQGGYKRQSGRNKKAVKSLKSEDDTQLLKIIVAPKTDNKKRFFCPVCGKSYGSANGIKYHAEHGHGPKSTFTCEICNKAYASKHGLAAHKRSHDIRAKAEALEMKRLQQQQLNQQEQQL